MTRNREENYFIVQLFTKEDFTDRSLLDFKRERDIELTIKDYSTYLTSHIIGSELSKQVIDFFIEYDNETLMPERCDAQEPVRDKFNREDTSGPVRWLSQPGGAVFLKGSKTFKYEGRIENHRFAPVWREGKFLKPKVEEPRFLGEIVLYIDVSSLKKKPDDYLFNLLLKLARIVKASYGLASSSEEYSNKQIDATKIDEIHRLPGSFWINYFGPDYVSLFEEELIGISSTSKKSNKEADIIFMME